MSGDRTLAFLRELERADAETAAVLGELDELARAAEDVRTRAVQLEAVLGRLPAERARIGGVVTEAERAAARWRAALAEAGQQRAGAERGRDVEREAAARRAEVRARDALRMSERKLAAAKQESRRLEEEAGAARRDAETVQARARELAAVLATRPGLAEQAGSAPDRGLAAAAEWASRARASLFVARGRLAVEREGLIRQATELGGLVLGEPLTAGSAGQIARRVERARRA